MVQQVFGLFKTYLTSQLDENGKQLKTQSKVEKEACEFKSRGNRKQFEFNASVDAILTDIASKADSPDVQAIGQKPAGSAGRLQTEVGGFIPAVQLPTEALEEDPSMEPQNEDLDIVHRLVEGG